MTKQAYNKRSDIPAEDQEFVYVGGYGNMAYPDRVIKKYGLSHEETVACVADLVAGPGYLRYVIATKKGDETRFFYRGIDGQGIPCYGELATYKITHGEFGSRNSYRPDDLFYPYPLVERDGEIVAVGVGKQHDFDQTVLSWVLDEKSPYIKGFLSKENVLVGPNYIVLKETSVDPTVFMRFTYCLGYKPPENPIIRLIDTLDLTLAEKIQITFTFGGGFYLKSNLWLPSSYTSGLSGPLSTKRLTEQNPIDISMGTIREGYGYTRSYNEYLFSMNTTGKSKLYAMTPKLIKAGFKANSDMRFSLDEISKNPKGLEKVFKDYLTWVKETFDEYPDDIVKKWFPEEKNQAKETA